MSNSDWFNYSWILTILVNSLALFYDFNKSNKSGKQIIQKKAQMRRYGW